MKSLEVTVLLSGGLDSSTALHWAAKHHHVNMALSFYYGSKQAEQELECAKFQAQHLGISHQIVDISSISPLLKSAMLKNGAPIPEGRYEVDNMRQTVVPFRNGIFLSIAAGIAESAGAQALVIAAHSGDHTIYPDCREDFMTAMSEAIRLGTWANLGILRPFINASKGDIVKQASDLRVDLSKTYSCYKGGPVHCGVCATCLERKEAFLQAHIPDPTTYLL